MQQLLRTSNFVPKIIWLKLTQVIITISKTMTQNYIKFSPDIVSITFT